MYTFYVQYTSYVNHVVTNVYMYIVLLSTEQVYEVAHEGVGQGEQDKREGEGEGRGSDEYEQESTVEASKCMDNFSVILTYVHLCPVILPSVCALCTCTCADEGIRAERPPTESTGQEASQVYTILHAVSHAFPDIIIT